MSLTITLLTDPILTEIKQKSFQETENIPDPLVRYNSRAAEENQAEVVRCILNGLSQLSRRCGRFLRAGHPSSVDNISGLPESYEFEFNFSERRGVNKAEALVDVMNAFVVQYALSRFYATVNQGELSNAHSLAALDYGNQIDELLYTKQPPRV